jgi:hypothetical protein
MRHMPNCVRRRLCCAMSIRRSYSSHTFCRAGSLTSGYRCVMIAMFLIVPLNLVPALQSTTSAFVDVSVVTMTDAVVREHQTVIVRGTTIVEVGGRMEVRPPPGTVLIDGRGKFLLPGLVDAHVHLMEAPDLPQFLAYGVTTVRNLTGSATVLAWRDSVARGLLVGPRIFTSGPLFAGREVPWRSKVVPRDATEARAEVRRQHDAGYDLIKIYDGLSADVYAAVLDEAKRLGMRVTGHIPEQVHLAGVLRARQDIEHTDKIVFDVWGHTFDTTRIDSVAQAIRAAGIFVTPTIASMEQMARINSGGFDSLLARPEARRVGAATLAFWCDVSSRLGGHRSRAPRVRFDAWTDFQLKVIAAERRAGVPLLAGTDYPNAMLAPGSGLLEELRALEDAGLTPFEALGAATRTASQVIGDMTSGRIVPGGRADLVLLRANPLLDLRALDENDGVMVAGRWFSQADLNRLAPLRPVAPTCPR